jgi:hypothetical protein
MFKNSAIFYVFNYKVSQIWPIAWFYNDTEILYFSNVAALKFFELFGMCKKGLSGCYRGKRDIEDFENDISFFTLFIFAQVGIADGTFVERSDDSIVANALWSCVSHVGILSP